MTNLDVKININKLKDYSRKLKCTVDEETLILMIEYFSEYVLEFYGRLIVDAIYSKTYKGNWEPVEDRHYREYLGTKPSGDIIKLMRDTLEVEKIGYNYIVRFNPYIKYPKSRRSVLHVLRAIEGGTSKFKARPLFHKIVLPLRKKQLELWKGYLSMKGVV